MNTVKLLLLGVRLCFIPGLLLSGIKIGLSQEIPPYMNPDLPIEERINDLLPRMILDEKAVQLADQCPNAVVRLEIPGTGRSSWI